ncbi:hypothetical protein CDO22_24490 (plasmid) [Sinorhizobium meliloti]|nr:hypothetical protein CDO22_24490 [Sinorhizobium meliloti]
MLAETDHDGRGRRIEAEHGVLETHPLRTGVVLAVQRGMTTHALAGLVLWSREAGEQDLLYGSQSIPVS